MYVFVAFVASYCVLISSTSAVVVLAAGAVGLCLLPSTRAFLTLIFLQTVSARRRSAFAGDTPMTCMGSLSLPLLAADLGIYDRIALSFFRVAQPRALPLSPTLGEAYPGVVS